MHELFRTWLLPWTAFLYTKVLVTPWCFIDLWSFIHLGTGGLIMSFLQHRGVRRPFGVLLVLLVGYEVVELVLTALAGLFLPEILPDQVTDVAIGMAGGLFAWIAGRLAETGDTADVPLRADVPVAAGLALVWVGAYGYRYDVAALNSRFVNWWALLLWTAALLIMFRAYNALRPMLPHPTMALSVVWVLFTCALFAAEYLGYTILRIRELHAGAPMAFGLIHGTPLLKIVYATAPAVAIGTRALLRVAARSREFRVLPGAPLAD